ncbi:urea transporter 1-like [Tubulanus polymorphus]|uniref:urea transporter 1-like n=1 Tax=Tubulanus polymorphus TaxID=672921 RepID=UPI003DA5C64B
MMYSDIATITNSEQAIGARPVSSSFTSRRFGAFYNKPKFVTFIQTYVTGDINILTAYLKRQHPVFNLPILFLRAVSAPIFLNNPISGFVILVALFVGHPWHALCGTVGLVAAIAIALISRQNNDLLGNGSVTCNGLLVGLFLSLYIQRPDWTPTILLPIIIIAAFTPLVVSGLNDTFSRLDLPIFNLPFNICTIVFLGASGKSNYFFPVEIQSAEHLNAQSFANSTVDWNQILLAIPCGVSRIYGIENYVTGCLILIAVAIAQPITLLHVVLSAFLAVATGLSLAVPPIQIYSGMWSYNSILTSTALGGYFWVFTWQSTLLALSAGLFTTYTYGCMCNVSQSFGLPPIQFPFALTTLIFIAITTNSHGLVRVPLNDVTYPEEHLSKYRQLLVLEEEHAIQQQVAEDRANRLIESSGLSEDHRTWSPDNEYWGDKSATTSNNSSSKF